MYIVKRSFVISFPDSPYLCNAKAGLFLEFDNGVMDDYVQVPASAHQKVSGSKFLLSFWHVN